MKILFNIKRPARLESLNYLIDMIGSCAKEQGLSEKKINEIRIAAEEALMNIINYAYKQKEGYVEVVCKTEPEGTFVIEIIDTGIAFDPFSVPEPDITQDIDTRQIGGMGIFLIRKLTDDFHYRRDGDKNIQELVIKLTPHN
ncbi:MAG TPA: ATP-binding protein [Syntrophorhabdaceae bacterium]|nr:ATP-binding protein [Syntrophorhabdaceae bacterium]HPU30272.1 ATP-binding protein [Syntrophorhabdaceae bacterium]